MQFSLALRRFFAWFTHAMNKPNSVKKRIYRFAGFELIAAEGELRTGNTSVRLQEKPLLLLTALLDSPQELVTREQLRERMWDSQTFVDHEQGINVAVKKVRDTLGDSAEEPTYIQTVAKRGYRFLLRVDVTEPEGTAPPVPDPLPALAASQNGHGAPRFRVRLMVTGLGAGVLLLFTLWFAHIQATRGRPAQVHSVAVLPLLNLSPEPGQDYFADGVTKELITDLAQSLPQPVISRTSVMRYKQTSEPITRIAQELGVQAIVEGAVARSGDRVTVTVRLIDAAEDRHLWAQKYDRDVKDLLDGTDLSGSKAAKRRPGRAPRKLQDRNRLCRPCSVARLRRTQNRSPLSEAGGRDGPVNPT
jgi:TolB-like protein/DNA-binding winged helix-turn-helix (wHTH) protein